jgi:hypothetical protein
MRDSRGVASYEMPMPMIGESLTFGDVVCIYASFLFEISEALGRSRICAIHLETLPELGHWTGLSKPAAGPKRGRAGLFGCSALSSAAALRTDALQPKRHCTSVLSLAIVGPDDVGSGYPAVHCSG